MELVKVDNENLDLAYKIQKEIFPDEPDYLFLKRAVDSDKNELNHYIAYVDGRPVGITGTYTEKCDQDSIWLSWFGVLPNERRKGYGKEMLLATLNICKALPYKFFRCYTSFIANASAQPLYQSIFQICEKYQNRDDETYNDSLLIYSMSLCNEKVPYWNNKYMGVKEYDELTKEGEEYLKQKNKRKI